MSECVCCVCLSRCCTRSQTIMDAITTTLRIQNMCRCTLEHVCPSRLIPVFFGLPSSIGAKPMAALWLNHETVHKVCLACRVHTASQHISSAVCVNNMNCARRKSLKHTHANAITLRLRARYVCGTLAPHTRIVQYKAIDKGALFATLIRSIQYTHTWTRLFYAGFASFKRFRSMLAPVSISW